MAQNCGDRGKSELEVVGDTAQVSDGRETKKIRRLIKRKRRFAGPGS